MLYFLFTIAAATQPTWLVPGNHAGPSMTAETTTLLVVECFAGDGNAYGTWAQTQTDTTNTQAPLKSQAIGYCLDWAPQIGGAGNLVVNPMNQQATNCAVYHCLEDFFGFSAVDIANVECMMSYIMTNFNGVSLGVPHVAFPDSYAGADSTDYSSSSCVCNSDLAAAAPTPMEPKWLAYTGTVGLCVSKVNWDPTNAPFFGCALRACMPEGSMRDYLICTQDEYYGFEGLDACSKLDKAVLGNIAMPIPLTIVAFVSAFFAMVGYVVFAMCCKKSAASGGKIGV